MMRDALIALTVGSRLFLGAQDWDAADRATKRLAPAQFVDLPVSVRTELEGRGCTIPQPFTARRPVNVIKGRFTSAHQTDWAVLCSRQRTSSILVFRGRVRSAVAEIAAHADIESLQTIDGDRAVGYSREIAIATDRYIQDHHNRYGGPKPPPLDHEGINDLLIEKGSVVWYWYGGAWLELQGAD